MHLYLSLVGFFAVWGSHALKIWQNDGSHQQNQLMAGYLTTGFGEKFLHDANELCQSLKRFRDDTPFAILTSQDEAIMLESEATACFDLVIAFHENPNISLLHERFNVDPMIRLLEVLPFQETIFFDSDVLRTEFCNPWEFMRQASTKANQAVMVFGRGTDCTWHWNTACKLSKKHNMHFSHTHAGMMYIRLDGNYSTQAKNFFSYAQEANRNYDDLGFKKAFKGGSKCLEIHWSYAFAKMGWLPLEFGEQDMFCFNWKPGEKIPPQLLRVSNLAESNTSKQFCHAHMFERPDHNKLFDMIMGNASTQNLIHVEKHDPDSKYKNMVARMKKQGGNMDKFYQDLFRVSKTIGRKSATRNRVLLKRNASSQYGFFMQVSNDSKAVQNVLTQVRKYYKHEKFMLFSDRSLDYSGMCKRFGCSFAHAGKKAGIWGDDDSGPRFLRRIVSAMRACDCETLILLEDDTCLHGLLGQPPPSDGDIGGVPWPFFSDEFLNYAQKESGVVPHVPEVWGCTGGCYFRTAELLAAFEKKPDLLDADSDLFQELTDILGERVKYGDVYPVAAAMVAGATVIPWQEVSESNLHYDVNLERRVKVRPRSPARLEHKCSEQLNLRNNQADTTLARMLPENELDALSEDGVLITPEELPY